MAPSALLPLSAQSVAEEIAITNESRRIHMRTTLLVTMLAGGLCFAQSPAPVKVEGGLLAGTSEDGLAVYRGIPFAAPPVGDLRWRAPQPAAKWEGVRQAAKFAPGCMQATRGPSGQGPGVSEDCLYLNVWTPAKSRERPHPRSGLDLRRRIRRGRYQRAKLQRRETGEEGRGAGQHRLPGRADGILRAPGAERREPATRFRATTACWT